MCLTCVLDFLRHPRHTTVMVCVYVGVVAVQKLCGVLSWSAPQKLVLGAAEAEVMSGSPSTSPPWVTWSRPARKNRSTSGGSSPTLDWSGLVQLQCSLSNIIPPPPPLREQHSCQNNAIFSLVESGSSFSFHFFFFFLKTNVSRDSGLGWYLRDADYCPANCYPSLQYVASIHLHGHGCLGLNDALLLCRLCLFTVRANNALIGQAGGVVSVFFSACTIVLARGGY